MSRDNTRASIGWRAVPVLSHISDIADNCAVDSHPKPTILSRFRMAYMLVSVLTISCHGVKRSAVGVSRSTRDGIVWVRTEELVRAADP